MEYRNAKYISTGDTVDCEIEHPKYGWIPYTLDHEDTDMTVDNEELYSRMLAAGDIAAYVPPTDAEAKAANAADIRRQRDVMLEQLVDPVVCNSLRWNDLSKGQQAAWKIFRLALLDVPQQPDFPEHVDWPVKPE